MKFSKILGLFQNVLLYFYYKNAFFQSKRETFCEKCDNRTTKLNLARIILFFEKANDYLDLFINEVDGTNLKEELRSCQRFLVDSELEKAGHKQFKYAIANLNVTEVNEKLDHFFNSSKCAVKVNLAFGFFLKEEKEISDVFLRTKTLPC